MFDCDGYILLYCGVGCYVEGCWEDEFGLIAAIDFWDLGCNDALEVHEDSTLRSYLCPV